jgi:L-alanine-DL-glutamate epimerase-like enolase superfamily enzyme
MSLAQESWALRSPFRITGSITVAQEVLVVTLRQDDQVGRGEASGVDYLHDDVPSMARQLEACREDIESGLSRQRIASLPLSSGARNALDCALWDLEAKLTGIPVWQRAGLNRPSALRTTWTLGADTPEAMSRAASAYPSARAIKIKLVGDTEDAARVTAVRQSRPDVWLGVDANQGWDRGQFDVLLPHLLKSEVKLIEQPFPRADRVPLASLGSPIPIAADESVQNVSDLPGLVGFFDCLNIKLDKAGGLTGALNMAREAQRCGFDLMVGNMIGTSLAMAPAYLVGQLCRIVDLDGPLLLRDDRRRSVSYADGNIQCETDVWGGAAAEGAEGV